MQRFANQLSKRTMKIYTKTGDKGTSQLYSGERRSKDDRVFMALGDTDELNAMLGVVREHWRPLANEAEINVASQIENIQSRLFDVGSAIATPRSSASEIKKNRTLFPDISVPQVEEWIDEMDATLPPLQNFILPSGGLCSTHFHVARAICRRAERRVVSLIADEEVEPSVGIYLNRLSDYFFVCARYTAKLSEHPETIWTKQ